MQAHFDCILGIMEIFIPEELLVVDQSMPIGRVSIASRSMSQILTTSSNRDASFQTLLGDPRKTLYATELSELTMDDMTLGRPLLRLVLYHMSHFVERYLYTSSKSKDSPGKIRQFETLSLILSRFVPLALPDDHYSLKLGSDFIAFARQVIHLCNSLFRRTLWKF